jgi:hypothetical protein
MPSEALVMTKQMGQLPVELVQKTFLSGEANAIFRLQTERQVSVFMSVRRTNDCNDQRSVVVADAMRFLDAWRGGRRVKSHHPIIEMIKDVFKPQLIEEAEWLPQQSRETWMKDRKYAGAVEGFSRGIENPVPLADVRFLGGSTNAVGFTNGMTRTLWLLANGVSAFPVQCATSDASDLFQSCGVDWASPLTVQDLLGDLKWSDWLTTNANKYPASDQ